MKPILTKGEAIIAMQTLVCPLCNREFKDIDELQDDLRRHKADSLKVRKYKTATITLKELEKEK